MRYAILLQQRADGRFQASVPAMAELTQIADTRDEALAAIRQAIVAAMKTTELVYLDVPEDPHADANAWLVSAGLFADDDTLEPMLQEIYAARDAE